MSTPEGNILVLVTHRIVLDEQSLDLLSRTLCQLHDGGACFLVPLKMQLLTVLNYRQFRTRPASRSSTLRTGSP